MCPGRVADHKALWSRRVIIVISSIGIIIIIGIVVMLMSTTVAMLIRLWYDIVGAWAPTISEDLGGPQASRARGLSSRPKPRMRGLHPKPRPLGAALGRHLALSDNLGGAQEGFQGLQEGPQSALNVLVLSKAQK